MERVSVTLRELVAALAALAPLAVLGWLLDHPQANLEVEVPVEHFYIVTCVAVIAAVVAGLIARAALQMGVYRVLLLALAFAMMAALFAVHGLATPGVLLPDAESGYGRSVIGLSAYLSVFIPALLIAAAYTPWGRPLRGAVPFRPGGWLVVVAAVLVLSYGALALGDSRFVASLPLSAPPDSYGLALLSIGLLAFALVRQWMRYRVTRMRLQGALALALLLFAEAQLVMVTSPQWTLAWWEYHLLLLAGVALALRAIAAERVAGVSLRTMFEAALQLEVDVGAEFEDIEELATLAAVVEAQEPHRAGQQVAVAKLAVAIGRELGLSQPRLRLLARSALLVDVGRVALPGHLRRGSPELTRSDLKLLREHPELGYELLARRRSFREEAPIVRAHHERFDGHGYPRGLRAEEIPLEARIIAVAAAYEAHIAPDTYRGAFSATMAIRLVRALSGAAFDPHVVEALAAVVNAEPLLESRLHALAQPKRIGLITDIAGGE